MNIDPSSFLLNMSNSKSMNRYNLVSKLFGFRPNMPISIHNLPQKNSINNSKIQEQQSLNDNVTISENAQKTLASNTVTPTKAEVIPSIEQAKQQLKNKLENAGDKIKFDNDYIKVYDMYKGKTISYENADIAFNFRVLNADELAYNRQMVNNQISNILAKNDIKLEENENYSFSIDPYEYKIKVSGGSDEMNTKIETVLNSSEDDELYETNGFNLYAHIYNCTLYTESEQTTKETQLKRYVQNFVFEKTGVDLRECSKTDDDFLTQDGKSVKELLDNVIDTNSDGCSTWMTEEEKILFKQQQRSYVDSVLQYDFNDNNDQILKIDYNSSTGLHDVGQNHSYGVGDTDWIDDLSKEQEAKLGMTCARTFTYQSDE